ncbi:MAG: hypothetical protein AAB908_00970 [Patescibacteria group bacterium]
METDIIKSPDVSRIVEKQHLNKWVAFSPDYAEILAFGDRLVDVDKQVDGAKAVFAKILPDAFFAPADFSLQ